MNEIDMFQDKTTTTIEMDFHEIQIAYWDLVKLPNMTYEHRDVLPFSQESVIAILAKALLNNYRVMFEPIKKRKKKILTLWIAHNDMKKRLLNK